MEPRKKHSDDAKTLKSMNKNTSVKGKVKLRERLMTTESKILSAESNFRKETVCIKHINE